MEITPPGQLRFDTLYRDRLAPYVHVWRARRAALRRRGVFVHVAFAALVVFTVVVGFTVFGFLPIMPTFLLLALWAIVHQRTVARPRRRYFKGWFVQPMAEAFGLEYRTDNHVASTEFDRSALFEKQAYNRYDGEDYFWGRLDKTDIEFSELSVRYKTSGKNSKNITIFRGLFIAADFHKEFRHRTFVLPDVAEKRMGRLGRMLQSANLFQSGKLILMDNAEFEREFAIYAEDEIEARYLLSPLLMERILDYKRKCGGTLSLSFAGTRVYMAISGLNDLFEPGRHDADPREECRRLYWQLTLCVGVIDALNLNTRIWTKV